MAWWALKGVVLVLFCFQHQGLRYDGGGVASQRSNV